MSDLVAILACLIITAIAYVVMAKLLPTNSTPYYHGGKWNANPPSNPPSNH